MSLTYTAPEKRRRKQNPFKVPAAGTYPARIDAAVSRPVGDTPSTGQQKMEYELTWSVRAEGRRWKLPHICDGKEFGDVLVDIGLAGQQITEADLIGREAQITFQTFGGRTSAKIIDVEPLPVG